MRYAPRLTARHLGALTVVALAVAVAGSGCGADPMSVATTTVVRPPVIAALKIENSAYTTASVPAGTAFTMANNDGWPHSVTDKGGTFDVRLEGNTSVLLTIARPGVYQIYCDLHGRMRGSITVT